MKNFKEADKQQRQFSGSSLKGTVEDLSKGKVAGGGNADKNDVVLKQLANKIYTENQPATVWILNYPFKVFTKPKDRAFCKSSC